MPLTKHTVPFTEARQNLTIILDGIEQSGEPVTIIRRGKPAAVIVSVETFDRKVAKTTARFTLAGSGRVAPGVNIDQALQQAKQERIRREESRRKHRTGAER